MVRLHESAVKKGGMNLRGYLWMKRTADIALSCLALVMLSPVLLLISLAIVIDDPKGGPIFSQTRVGKNGRLFPIYKFRTMKIHSERLEESLSAEQLAEYRKEFKLDHDFRITRSGRLLRNSSLDELPQLVNIFCGHMSLVGPRPLIEDELREKYSASQQEILLSVRPGLTGLWQINGRNNCSYADGERQLLELHYAQNFSFSMDLYILFKTVKVVLAGTGK